MSDDTLMSFKRRAQSLLPKSWRSDLPVIPVVRLSGAIGMSTPFSQSLKLAGVAKTLEKAFSVKSAPAVALVINSPGGAAAQSHLIYRRIRDLAAANDKHVFAFVEDVAASGGYMIACAADEIVCDPASIVGSIGVVSASFGFQRLIDKIGVERRVHTSGAHKSMLDPFRPEDPEDVARLSAIQREIHALFRDLVKSRRGVTLNAADDVLFSGEFWIGVQALELGLVDALGDIRSTLRTRYGEDVRLQLVSPPSSFFMRRQPGVAAALPDFDAFPAAVAGSLVAQIEERALWSRFGL